jgi:hypothetical protein
MLHRGFPMNKYLMLTAAALLSSATSIDAKTYCFHFESNAGGSYCDGGRLTTGVDGGMLGGAARAWVHTNNNCVGGTSQGYGFLSKTPGLGKVSLMSDNFLAKNYNSYSTSIAWTFPKRIQQGAPYTIWVGMNGVTFFEVASSGFLVGVDNCKQGTKGRGRTSTLAALRELLRLHRQTKADSR